MNILQQKDLDFGLSNEVSILSMLRKFIDPTLEKTTNQYDPFDYRSRNCFVELKTRRICHNQYSDIMIGANKMRIALNTDKDVYFVFSCLDGIYYWRFNRDEYATSVKHRIGGTTRRGYDESIECCFIDTKVLLKCETC